MCIFAVHSIHGFEVEHIHFLKFVSDFLLSSKCSLFWNTKAFEGIRDKKQILILKQEYIA
jgi:hypothetical protein